MVLFSGGRCFAKNTDCIYIHIRKINVHRNLNFSPSTESEYEVEIAPLELRNSDNSAFDFKYTRHVYTPLSLSSSGLIVRVDTNMAGVRAEVLLIENRWVSRIDSPSFIVHSTSVMTGDVIESVITEAHVREILSPVVTFPNGN